LLPPLPLEEIILKQEYGVFLGLTVYLILGERNKMIFEILLHLHGISLPEILSDVLQSFSLS
jgi:hypothetical protein